MKTTCVVAFAFGAPSTIYSNWRLARIAVQQAQELDALIYTQNDIVITNDAALAVYAKEEPGQPPPTLRIARGAVGLAKRLGLVELVVVAAKPHLRRALRDVREAAREAGGKIKVRACRECELYPEDSWFCPDSTQERTRSLGKWEKREKILRRTPFFLYKLFAKLFAK